MDDSSRNSSLRLTPVGRHSKRKKTSLRHAEGAQEPVVFFSLGQDFCIFLKVFFARVLQVFMFCGVCLEVFLEVFPVFCSCSVFPFLYNVFLVGCSRFFHFF